MEIFYKKSQTKYQKLATTILYLIFPLSFIGFFSRTLIYQWFLDLFFYPVLLMSLVVASVVAYQILFRVRDRVEGELKKRNKKLWTGVIGVYIFVPIFFYSALLKGVPVLIHSLTYSSSEVHLKVRKKSYRYSVKHCRSGAIFIEGYDYFLNDKLCGFIKSDWESIAAGDRIILMGKVSKFGFTVNKNQKLTIKASLTPQAAQLL